MTSNSLVFLAGASRGVGREIAHCLIERSLRVKALLRSNLAQSELEAMGIRVAIGDALNLDDVEQAMQGEPITAVISTIGGLPKDGQRADYLGNKNLIDASIRAGVRRFILVTSIGSGDSAVALPSQVLQTLESVLVEKYQAEQYLINSGLTYTIIRPGGLKSEPSTGQAVLTADPTIAGSIHRADVAQLVCRCLLSDRADCQVLSAIDRQMTYTQKPYEVFDFD
jgi:nucleoside-diphosphate-sugar epimerase